MSDGALDFHPDYPVGFMDEPLPPARELRRIGPKMDQAIASRAFIVGMTGPVGSGKTIGFSMKFQHIAMRQRGMMNSAGQLIRRSRFAMIRDTYPNLDRNTIPSWQKVVPRHAGSFVMSSPRVHKFAMVLRRAGHILDQSAKPIDIAEVEVEFRAIGDQAVEDALRGLEVTAALVNEADRTNKDILPFLAGRVGRYGEKDLVVDPQILLDLNGCDDENWTYKVLVENKMDDDLKKVLQESCGDRDLIDYIEQPPAIIEGEDIEGGWKVNPEAENLENLPKGYYERQYAFAKKNGDQMYIDRMLKGLFTPSKAGRSVFPEYIDALHCRAVEAVPGIPLLIMADQGLLGAVLIGQLVKGQLRILEEISCVFETENDEIEVVQMGGEALGAQVKELLATKYAGYEIGDAVCDPAGAQGEGAINFTSWREDFRAGLGHRVRKARVPRNAIAPRLKAVRTRLKSTIGAERTIVIHPRCKMTRRAFRTKYYFKRIGSRAGEGVYGDTPQKVQGYSDLMDALQYGCFEIARGLDLSTTGNQRLGGGSNVQHDRDFNEFTGA